MRSAAKLIGALAMAIAVLFAEGCTAQRLVAPPPLAPPLDRRPLVHTKIVVRSFEVTNASVEDLSRHTKPALEKAMMTSLMRSAYFGAIQNDLRGHGKLPNDVIQLDVAMRVEEDSDRTYVFDGLFFFPGFGVFPFTPEWGHANVELSWTLRQGKDVEGPTKVKVEAPFSMIFYSWYRTAPIEEAFQKAHERAFLEMTSRLLVQLQKREQRLYPEPEPVLAATSTAAERQLARSRPKEAPLVDPLRMMPDVGERIHLPHQGIGVVSEPFVRTAEDRGLIMTYLSALGGVEAALTRGSAGVSSSVTPVGGQSQTVASGHATSRGYGFALYKPPEKTGFFFPPSLGFLSQQIDIADFRQEIPVTFVQGATEIPATTHDATTGDVVDANAPIVYQLNLKSAYIGQSVGLNMVIGTEDVQLFSTLRGGVNLFEVRYMDVFFNDQRSKGFSVTGFQSFTGGAQIGLSLPIINVAIRAAVEYAYYASFKYPHPVQFRSAVVYNPIKMVNERPPVDVEGASLWTLDGQISLVYLF